MTGAININQRRRTSNQTASSPPPHRLARCRGTTVRQDPVGGIDSTPQPPLPAVGVANFEMHIWFSGPYCHLLCDTWQAPIAPADGKSCCDPIDGKPAHPSFALRLEENNAQCKGASFVSAGLLSIPFHTVGQLTKRPATLFPSCQASSKP